MNEWWKYNYGYEDEARAQVVLYVSFLRYLQIISNIDTTTTINAPHLHSLAEDCLKDDNDEGNDNDEWRGP